MNTPVWWSSRLRIWHCHSCRTGPSLGTSTCHKCSQKKKKKKKKAELCRFRTMFRSLLMHCHLKIWWIIKNRRYHLCIFVCLKALPPFELMTWNLLSLTNLICLSNIQYCRLYDVAPLMLSLPICFAFLGLAPWEIRSLDCHSNALKHN